MSCNTIQDILVKEMEKDIEKLIKWLKESGLEANEPKYLVAINT